MTSLLDHQLGNYRLTQFLGRSSFAETYLGEHVSFKTFAAIKVLQIQLLQGEQEAFYKEARTIAALKHPNIVRILEFGVEGAVPYLVMEYAPNGTLRQHHPKGIPVPPATIVPYVKQLAAGLQYAHNRKCLHRDVRPENMLLGAHNEVILSDFGLAVIADSTRDLQTMASTFTYTAPEQIQGKPRPASDQYALGMVVYEWLCGTVPFSGTSAAEVANQHGRVPPAPLREHVPAIPPDVEKVVMIALSKDPQQRFGNIEAFAKALALASGVEERVPLPHTYADDLPTEGDSYDTPLRLPPIQQMPYGGYKTQLAPPISENQQVLSSGRSSAAQPPNTPLPLDDISTSATQTIGTKISPQPLLPLQTQPPSPTTRHMSLGWLLTIIVLALFIGGSTLYYFTNIYPQQQKDQAKPPLATPTSATSTAQVDATQTAVAQATAVVQTTIADQQNIYNQATSGTPTITDSLKAQDSNNWTTTGFTDANGNSSGSCAFTASAYHVSAQPTFFTTCYAASITMADFALQVDMMIVKGHSGGIAFRSPANAHGSTYLLRISTDGTYMLERDTVDSNGNDNQTPLTSGSSSAIKQGNNQHNVIAVVARGSNFYLYANTQYIGSASDATYASGQIGVYAESDISGAVEAVFTNLQVWQLR